ncbi:MAG: preprotein translocase subunit SecE [Clostridia bacterium]|nr:preprotein translocase subunit SecE [Clostridia bacterium]
MAKKEAKIDNKKEKKSKKDKTSFFKSFKAELKKVSWPTPKQLINNTTAVVVIVIILAAIVFVLDSAFGAANKYGIDSIKKSVAPVEQTTESTEGETTENGSEDVNADDVVEPEESVDEESNEVTIEAPDGVTAVTE